MQIRFNVKEINDFIKENFNHKRYLGKLSKLSLCEIDKILADKRHDFEPRVLHNIVVSTGLKFEDLVISYKCYNRNERIIISLLKQSKTPIIS